MAVQDNDCLFADCKVRLQHTDLLYSPGPIKEDPGLAGGIPEGKAILNVAKKGT